VVSQKGDYCIYTVYTVTDLKKKTALKIRERGRVQKHFEVFQMDLKFNFALYCPPDERPHLSEPEGGLSKGKLLAIYNYTTVDSH